MAARVQQCPFLTRSRGNLCVMCVKLERIARLREMRYGLDRSIIRSDKWSDRRKSYFRWRDSRGQHGRRRQTCSEYSTNVELDDSIVTVWGWDKGVAR